MLLKLLAQNIKIMTWNIWRFSNIQLPWNKEYYVGEGGCIVINNKSLEERIDIILEKGTNRRNFMRVLSTNTSG